MRSILSDVDVETSEPDLRRAVLISRQIQEISRDAFAMRIEATNAIVVTHSRQIRVPGFEVVSQQMNSTCRELMSLLDQLRHHTQMWVRAASARLAHTRELGALAAARTAAGSVAQLADVIATVERERDDAGSADRSRFSAALDEVARIAATGCVLARTAKIEAVYGGGLADVLMGTAAAFTVLADRVDAAVRMILRSTEVRADDAHARSSR